MLPLLPAKSSMRRAGAATAIAALSLIALFPAPATAQVAAQADPGSTTTTTVAASPGDTLTPSVPPAPAPTTTVAVPAEPARTTTTTTTTVVAPPPAWVANVPGPPPPPAVTASPDQLAQAARLEQKLVTQSKAMDIMAEQYDQAQQVLQATTGRLAQTQADLAAAEAKDRDARAAVDQSRRVLRDAAVAAYVGIAAHRRPAATDTLIESYLRGRAQAAVKSALGQADDALQKLRADQGQANRVRDSIGLQQRTAAAESDAARAAADKTRLGAQAAAAAQVQLLATVSTLQGDVGTLVAAAQAAEVLAAYRRFSTGGGQLDFPTPVPVAAPSTQVMAALQAALAQVGKPYVWGATGPDTFDCSGLMQWSWRQAGVATPRVAADQQAWAVPVPISQLQPGDFVFFGSPAHHVGMYVGNGTMVDAPHSGAYVGVVPIWWNDLTGFGRVHQP